MDNSPTQASPDHRRLGLMAGVLAGAVLIGLGAWALAPRAAGAPGPAGPRLSISLVAPTEPAPVEGGVLDVGMLNDAFDRAALDRSPERALADDVPLDAYAGEDLPPPNLMPEPRPMVRQVSSSEGSIITSTDPLADGSRLFGFDRRPPASTATATGPGPAPAPEDAALRIDTATASQSFFQ